MRRRLPDLLAEVAALFSVNANRPVRGYQTPVRNPGRPDLNANGSPDARLIRRGGWIGIRRARGKSEPPECRGGDHRSLLRWLARGDSPCTRRNP